jgi:hypothetical protein
MISNPGNKTEKLPLKVDGVLVRPWVTLAGQSRCPHSIIKALKYLVKMIKL